MYDGLIPNVEIVRRPMHIYFLIDCSTSMQGERIHAVNQGIPAAIHAVTQSVKQHPEVEVRVNLLRIGSEAEWLTPEGGVPLKEFEWKNLEAKGKTLTGHGINMLCDRLEVKVMGSRGYPPACIMISDGWHTDSQAFYDGAVNRLNSIPWGVKAVRLVLAIGKEDDYDSNSLLKFSNQGEAGLIKVQNYREIVPYINFATIAATIGATRSRMVDSKPNANVALPAIPKPGEIW